MHWWYKMYLIEKLERMQLKTGIETIVTIENKK
jgi:hypothetical protein